MAAYRWRSDPLTEETATCVPHYQTVCNTFEQDVPFNRKPYKSTTTEARKKMLLKM